MPKLMKMEGKLVVGLTGGIASGKTTVLNEFRKKGVSVFDCDQIVREAVQPGKPALNEIIRKFGKEILSKRGSLDRNVLANIIFDDEKKRLDLEKIIHPKVIKHLKKAIQSCASKLVIVDIPLLFEANLQRLVDKIIVVWVPKKIQIERLIKRNHLPKSDALNRLNAQWNLNKKRVLADFVIDNSLTPTHTKKQTQRILEHLTKTENDV